jgi:hypothetical protein
MLKEPKKPARFLGNPRFLMFSYTPNGQRRMTCPALDQPR